MPDTQLIVQLSGPVKRRMPSHIAGLYAPPQAIAVCGNLSAMLQAFFNGGILSNDATTPVNGSAFEVLDLRTMSPLVIQVSVVPLAHILSEHETHC